MRRLQRETVWLVGMSMIALLVGMPALPHTAVSEAAGGASRADGWQDGEKRYAPPTPTFPFGLDPNPVPTPPVPSLPEPLPLPTSIPTLPIALPTEVDATPVATPATFPDTRLPDTGVDVEPQVSYQPIPNLDNTPKFLTLPFPPDPKIQLLQGWYYDSLGLHNGLDFFRYDSTEGFTGYPILAAADGFACGQRDDYTPPEERASPTSQPTNAPTITPPPPGWWTDDPKLFDPWLDLPHFNRKPEETPPPDDQQATNRGMYCVSGFGDRVLLRHQIGTQTFYTYYGHLATIADTIPIGSRSNTVFVKRGQILGYAGNTGTGGGAIHLHFGLATPSFGWLDPYDIWQTHEVYPDTRGVNGFYAGPNNFWTTNPPSHSTELKQRPEGAILRPTYKAVVAGTATITGWARVQGSEIRRVEIWIDGELHGIAEYGLPHDDPAGNYGFRWQWDTAQAPNGQYMIEARAITMRGDSVPLRFEVLEDEEAMDSDQPDLDGQATEPKGYRNDNKEQPISFPVTVKNPTGSVEWPAFDSIVSGKVNISGWATASESEITKVEVWIDDQLLGTAEYGLPHEKARGKYGFLLPWNTTHQENGLHTLQVKAFAVNGGSATLKVGDESYELTLPVSVKNELIRTMDKWTMR